MENTIDVLSQVFESKNIKIYSNNNEYNFCGKDACTILGYSNYHKALRTHVPEECKYTLTTLGYPNLGQPKLSYNELQMIYINEEGLYRLIFNCQLPVAKKFQKWIFKEVLPTIRKTGKFELKNALKSKEDELSQAMERLAIKEKSEEDLLKEQEELQRQLQQEKQRAEKAEKEAEEQRQYSLILKELAINDQKRPLDERIYISTSKAYAGHNRFKVGGVESMDKLKPRFSGYNGRSSVDDMWYYSDLFKVANFKAAEKRIEDVLGRFRERKNKEIYVLHYSDLRRYVEWICDHYEDEIEKFNIELDVLIGNLNRHQLRPVIPPPYQGTSATITRIVDGIPTNTTIEDSIEDQFKHKIKVYLDTLNPNTKEIKRTDLFSKVDINFNKIEAWRWLKEIIPQYKPNIKLTNYFNAFNKH
jgi:prophage antirepressor-like protein